MPRARRRRRGRGPGRRPIGRVVVTWLVVAVVLALAIASVAEIHAQSATERQVTDQGWGKLASRVALASNQTGTQLATIVRDAPAIPNEPWSSTNGASDRFVPSPGSNSARMQIQQALDAAVAAADQEAVEAARLAPPGPAGDVAARFAAVMATRDATTTSVRTTIDNWLGMAPLPVAGAPATTGSATTLPADGVARITLTQATSQAVAEGTAFQQADHAYAVLAAELRTGRLTGTPPIRLPRSVWAAPGTPLTSADLGATPALLSPGSTALVPYHQLVITAVGLIPAAVPAATPGDQAASGIVGTACSTPTSASPVAGAAATVLPPTSTVSAQVTVTNCGTVTETNIPVSETLQLQDPAGTRPPATADSGGTLRTDVTIPAGGSQALGLGALAVAGGHDYLLTVALVVPPPPAGQTDLTGTTQEFLLKVSS